MEILIYAYFTGFFNRGSRNRNVVDEMQVRSSRRHTNTTTENELDNEINVLIHEQPNATPENDIDVVTTEQPDLKNHRKFCANVPSPKRAKYEKRPINSIRYDGKNHLPQIDNKENGTRCKNDNCKSKSHTFCCKCGVHLCPRCFKPFHELNFPNNQ